MQSVTRTSFSNSDGSSSEEFFEEALCKYALTITIMPLTVAINDFLIVSFCLFLARLFTDDCFSTRDCC